MARPTILSARLPLKLVRREDITGCPIVLLRLLLELAAIAGGDIAIPIPRSKLKDKTNAIILFFTLVLIFIFTSINLYLRLLMGILLLIMHTTFW
jgi:hypothetical protein